MIGNFPPLIVLILRNPLFASRLSLAQWDLLVRQARCSGLLARIGMILEQNDVSIPTQPANHFSSAKIYAEQFSLSLRWEIKLINRALLAYKIRPIFLKGSSYFLAKNHAALGRVFTDVDILVNKSDLDKTEQALMSAGWMTATSLTEYDQKYYRQWMHEIPPLHNYRRGTSIDVHHNILPLTCKDCPNAKKLIDAKIEVDGEWLLSDIDRVLHSATHLFHEGEFEFGLRDLSDLDLLIREFSSIPNFWERLLK